MPGAPEITAYQATSIACHVEIRVELRKGVEKDGQKTMTELDEEPANRVTVDGLTYEFEIKDDPERAEGETTCFLNAWQLDDDGMRIHERIQGVQFASEADALEFWDQFAAQSEMTILEWLIQLTHHDFDAQQKLWNVFLAPSTFDAVGSALEEAYAEYPDALAQLAEFDRLGEIPLHGRLYCRAEPDDDGAHVFQADNSVYPEFDPESMVVDEGAAIPEGAIIVGREPEDVPEIMRRPEEVAAPAPQPEPEKPAAKPTRKRA